MSGFASSPTFWWRSLLLDEGTPPYLGELIIIYLIIKLGVDGGGRVTGWQGERYEDPYLVSSIHNIIEIQLISIYQNK